MWDTVANRSSNWKMTGKDPDRNFADGQPHAGSLVDRQTMPKPVLVRCFGDGARGATKPARLVPTEPVSTAAEGYFGGLVPVPGHSSNARFWGIPRSVTLERHGVTAIHVVAETLARHLLMTTSAPPSRSSANNLRPLSALERVKGTDPCQLLPARFGHRSA